MIAARECAWCWKSTSTPKEGGLHVQTLITNALRSEGLITSESRYLHVSCANKARTSLRLAAAKHKRLVNLIKKAL